MKARLFWKILLAFWITFLAITQGVWLLFEANRLRHAGPDGLAPVEAGQTILAAGANLVHIGGTAAFDRYVAGLSPRQQARLQRLAQPLPPDPVWLVQQATTPDGHVLWLRYQVAPRGPRPAHGLNVPPEMLLLGLLGGLAFSAALAWYLTSPINRLRQGFGALASGDLGTRLVPRMGRRRDEIADLAHDFDRMAQRLEELVAMRDRLLHDVSHELRSPLARLTLAIGLARLSPTGIDHALDRIEHEAGRLDGLVGELLQLARLEHQDAPGEDYFDLADLVAGVLAEARIEADAAGVALVYAPDLPPEEDRPALRGQAILVHRAIDNVVRNALRFTPRGGAVRATLALGDGAYVLAVQDEGTGVAEAMLAMMFEPFVRGEPVGDGQGQPSGGPGLGLAIAHRAIAAHGGTIAARNRPPHGLEVTITLPVGTLPAAG
ncbi:MULTISPECIES: HAMP domain-containing sensor histidine kinase [unclassified Novosphingobium]|uniref:HAMP domain-containing sensor histidine kinase n=1 Tax=unclassified Novosphingobium TaxID=2644732 RepID=UPI00146AD78D|nr:MULTISPECIES: HAMP domain-containing sensor histidine kinase [unclassified Novosphingobium]NMN04425.1 two-component system OmpR family sensor kinase [Novosphingobium sp. SG919]NMN85584.1 two-component system OmpR family sensor kinase [Novosphingobium sp. SG916]